MFSFLLIGAALAGWLVLGRRGGSAKITRIQRPGPFPPYDWFLKEQSPEELGLSRRASRDDGASA